MKLVYTVDAIEDLVRLFEFIEVHNLDAAQKISVQLIEGMNGLVANPQIGVAVSRSPEPDSMRDLVVEHYVARYIYRKEMIVILRIWHQREER